MAIRTGFETRREWFASSAGGLAGVALASLFARDGEAGAGDRRADGGLHHAPRAKRVVQLFMAGGASHVDLFDHKPELVKRHGQPADFGEPVEAFQNGLGPWLRPIWDFRPHGRCGKMLAEPVAALGEVADELLFVHDLVGRNGVHSQGTLLQTTGFNRPGFPSMGSWVSHGLGSMTDDLPTFVVLPDHRGLASNGTKNWDNAFLGASHQGTVVQPAADEPIADLRPDRRGGFVTAESDRRGDELLAALNRRHAEQRPGDDRLEARLRSYQLAARLQLAAPEALDWRREPKEVLKLYGLADVPATFAKEINVPEETFHFARRCLVARRLLERGTRFVQVWSGNDNGFPRRNWDSHEDVRRDHGPLAAGMARGAAALIADLKRTGLLKDTIVLWSTEFGRMPSSQGGVGRDHNPYCFTTWMAGGGVKGGATIGASDAFGYKPLDRKRPTEVHDVHATLLHLLGIDHERLTVRRDGIDRRLTDVHGKVRRDWLA